MPHLAANLQMYRRLLQLQLQQLDAMLATSAELVEIGAALEDGEVVTQLDSPQSVFQLPRAVPDIRKPARVRGVLAAVREIVEEIPGPFDKNDIMAKLKERHSDWANNVSPANLRNTLRILARDGAIQVQIGATSTTCAKYISKRVAA